MIVTLGLTSLIGLGLQAQSFAPIGYKASSMGGAGVASSKNAFASYYNPALLAKPDNNVEIAVGAGLGFVDNGAVESVNKLSDAGFFDLIDKANTNVLSLTPSDISTLANSRDIIIDMDGKGGQVSPNAYFSTQVDSFSVGIFGSAELTAGAVVDQAHNRLIINNGGAYVDVETLAVSNVTDYTNTSLEYAVNNGLTYLQVDALTLVEVPLSYGHAFETGAGDISLGGSFKFMQGTTHNGQADIDVEFDKLEDDLKSSEKKTTDFGIDLGVLYEPKAISDLRLGLVGKNLNKPSFERIDGSKIDIDPMIRVGVAYDIFESLEFAVDYDITENDTLLTSASQAYKTQYIGGGLNWHPVSWASLRAGLMENLSNDTEGLIYTAGLSFGPSFFQLDVSAQLSSEENTVDGDTYPASARVNIALISRW